MKQTFALKKEKWLVETTGNYRADACGTTGLSMGRWTASFHKLGDSEGQPVIGWVTNPEVDTLPEDNLRAALERALVERSRRAL